MPASEVFEKRPSLVIETDLGRDPDDFFAICYLAQLRDLKAILISPGDPDQVALARTMLRGLDLDIPIGVSRPLGQEKRSVGGWYPRWVQSRGGPDVATADGSGVEVLNSVLRSGPLDELFVCGPPKSTGQFLKQWSDQNVRIKLTVQGGFLPYSYLSDLDPQYRLAKFEGLNVCSTFNLGGAKEEAQILVTDSRLQAQFVGKNVCHTLVYTRDMYDKDRLRLHPVHVGPVSNARAIWWEGMDCHFSYKEGKALHDPAAAVMHVHPEIGTWVLGRPYYERGKWGTRPPEDSERSSRVLADVCRPILYQHLVALT